MTKKIDPLARLPRTAALWQKKPPSYLTRDMYWVYEFIRRLNTPFDKWPAFKAGIIDKQGNLLIKPDKLTPKQQMSFGYLDALSVGIKKLILRVPNVKQKLATVTGTMMLMKERKEPTHPNVQELSERFDEILNTLDENVIAVNSAGTGNIAGITGEPPVSREAQRKRLIKLLRRNTRV